MSPRSAATPPPAQRTDPQLSAEDLSRHGVELQGSGSATRTPRRGDSHVTARTAPPPTGSLPSARRPSRSPLSFATLQHPHLPALRPTVLGATSIAHARLLPLWEAAHARRRDGDRESGRRR